MLIVVKNSVAFGNGTRPQGFVLGETDADSIAGLAEADCTPADGVTDSEIRTAFLNPDFLELVGLGETSSEAVTAFGELGLDADIAEVLAAAGIRSVEALRGAEFDKIKGIGPARAKAIEDALSKW